jgi:hypothetical protein
LAAILEKPENFQIFSVFGEYVIKDAFYRKRYHYHNCSALNSMSIGRILKKIGATSELVENFEKT